MTLKRVTVEVSHSFELDIPEVLLDETNSEIYWALDDFIYDAFMDDEMNWPTVDIDIVN